MGPLVKAVLTCLALAALAAGWAHAQGVGAMPDFPLDEVRTGLQGYGLTEGPGGSNERFTVEVISVQHDAGPGFPLVLVRTSGELIEAAGGVAAGMSGSPVYLPRGNGDALLGAIGYVFPEADHDLALVAPIAAMRDRRVASIAEELHVAGIGSASPASTPVLMAGTTPRARSMSTTPVVSSTLWMRLIARWTCGSKS